MISISLLAEWLLIDVYLQFFKSSYLTEMIAQKIENSPAKALGAPPTGMMAMGRLFLLFFEG